MPLVRRWCCPDSVSICPGMSSGLAWLSPHCRATLFFKLKIPELGLLRSQLMPQNVKDFLSETLIGELCKILGQRLSPSLKKKFNSFDSKVFVGDLSGEKLKSRKADGEKIKKLKVVSFRGSTSERSTQFGSWENPDQWSGGCWSISSQVPH